jgi:paraquat-inducible protein A
MAGWAGIFARLHPGRRVRYSLADFGTRWDGLIWALLVLVPVALGLGLALPVLRFRRTTFFDFVVSTDYFSVAGGVSQLWAGEGYLPVALIVLYAVVSPLLRLTQAFRLWRWTGFSDKRFAGRLVRLRWLGRWSLAELLAAALCALYLTATGQTDATTEPGLYLLTAGIAGLALAQTVIARAAARKRGRGIVDYPDY